MWCPVRIKPLSFAYSYPVDLAQIYEKNIYIFSVLERERQGGGTEEQGERES